MLACRQFPLKMQEKGERNWRPSVCTIISSPTFFYTYDKLTVINLISGGSRIPRRKRRKLSRRGRQPTILPKFSKKLHEIAKMLGGAPGAPPLDPPLLIYEFR